VLEATATGVSLPAVLDQIVCLIEAQAAGMLCSLLLVDRAMGVLRHGSAPSLPEAFTRAIDGAPVGPAEGSCGTAAYRGEVVIVEDIATHPYWQAYRELALPHGLRACWSSPILSSGREVLGTFAMYYREPRLPTEVEQGWVQAATHLAGIAIQASHSRAVEAALLHSEEQLRALFDHVAVGIILVSADGHLIRVNSALCRILGYERHEFDALTLADLTHPDDLSLAVTLAAEVAAGTRESYQVEKRYIKKDGSVVWSRFTGSIVRGTDPLVGDLGIGLVEDISAQKRLEAQVLRSQRLDGLGRLAGGLAHDFNNLLTTVQGNVRVAMDELAPSESGGALGVDRLVAALNDIDQAAERATELVRRLLAFSPEAEPQRTIQPLAPVVQEVARLLAARLPARVALRQQLGGERPWVCADATQLHQVVMNLALNGAQAMPAGGTLTLRLAVQAGAEGGQWAVLSVSDNGPGIDPALFEQVFEPFFTTRPPGQGTGLGLPIVQAIAKAHQGHVQLRSEVGKGSTFEVWLPRVPALREESPATKSTSVRSPNAAAQLGRGEHVLVIDDEPSIVRLATRELERAGFRVAAFVDPEEALSVFLCAPDTFDALVTDASMPKLSGFDVARAVRVKRPTIPIVVISGGLWNRESQDVQSLAIGELLLKPMALIELGATLRRLLAREQPPER